MNKKEILNGIEESGIIAVLRLDDISQFDNIVDALLNGGVNTLEITLTTPNALELIKSFAGKNRNDFYLGAGTVLTPDDAKNVVKAGAQFIVSPILDFGIIEFANKNDIAVLPGAYTPTEIYRAWQAGADVVKVFPATSLGPKYFGDIRGPMPFLKLTPTGGVDVNNAADFIKAGASFLGAGTAMLDKTLIKNKDWAGLSALAAKFKSEVDRARKEINK